MKLSDIKGRRSLEIMADAMELAEIMSGDARLQAMMDDLKAMQESGETAWVVLCRHAPALLRDERYADRLISILAAASDMDVEEYERDGEVLKDLFELITTDAEALGFLSGAAATM